MTKPILNKTISIKDFKDNYWLKKELIDFCREIGINQSGGKLDIVARIERFLEVGDIITVSSQKKTKTSSSFDWNNEELNLSVVITDNYKNTDNPSLSIKDAIKSWKIKCDMPGKMIYNKADLVNLT